MDDQTNPQEIPENAGADNSGGQNGADFGHIASDLIDGMPEVSEHVVKEHAEKIGSDFNNLGESPNPNPERVESGPSVAGPLDKYGRSFNPEIHRHKDGVPSVSKLGNLLLKPGAPKPDESESKPERRQSVDSSIGGMGAPMSGHEEQPTPEGAGCQAPANFAAIGKVAAGALVSVSCMLGGEDFRPVVDPKQGINELATLEQAFGDWAQANDMTDIGPNTALVISVGAYMLPRFARPKVQSRVKTLWGGIKFKLSGWRKKWKNRGSVQDPTFDRQGEKEEK